MARRSIGRYCSNDLASLLFTASTKLFSSVGGAPWEIRSACQIPCAEELAEVVCAVILQDFVSFRVISRLDHDRRAIDLDFIISYSAHQEIAYREVRRNIRLGKTYGGCQERLNVDPSQLSVILPNDMDVLTIIATLIGMVVHDTPGYAGELSIFGYQVCPPQLDGKRPT
jgi:hypothetical protein